MLRRVFLAALLALGGAPLFADVELKALDSVDFDLPAKGAYITTFLGPSGAGKTTTVSVISGLVSINPGQDGALYADLTARKIWVADDKGGRFVDLGEAMRRGGGLREASGGANAALDEAFAKLEAQLVEMLKDVPEDQRPAVEEAARKAMGLPPKEEATRGRTDAAADRYVMVNSRGEPWHGHDTVVAEARSGDEVLRRLVLVDINEVLGARELVAGLAALDALHLEITGEPVPDEALVRDFVAVGGNHVIVQVETREGEVWVAQDPTFDWRNAPDVASAKALHAAMAAGK